ncbi:MAG: HAD-IB family hydrolase [Deltaproteobacteria bacterium]|nr:HAD-IB family hydrolase [Deltaproteobacteria bacterium]
MGRVVAIFDVDQTLVRGYTERLFFCHLLRRGGLAVPQAWNFLKRLSRNPRNRFRDKSYLGGLSVEDTLRLACECYENCIAPRLSVPGLACVREHQARGHEIVLLTGSLDFLLLPLKETLGAPWLIATEIGRMDGHFTGEITGLQPRGENKRRLLLELAGVHGMDLRLSYAYGDHIQDLHLFRAIGNPVAVNPSWRLKRLARKYRWPIRYF